MEKIVKLTIGICLLFLLIGAVMAINTDNLKSPSRLSKLGDDSFVDRQGHNIQICEDTAEFHEIWFENNTDYTVQPYENNNSFYTYIDGSDVDSDGIEAIGIIEVVEIDGVKCIVSSWTPNNGENKDVIFNNLLEFNKLNNLKPITLEIGC